MNATLVDLVAAGYATADIGVWRYADALELQFHAIDGPLKAEADAIRAAGVTDATLCSTETFLKAATVDWHSQRRFDFRPGGDRALMVAARDMFGEVIDIIAWPARAPERWARLEGRAFALGEAALDNPATFAFGGSLRVVRTPLGWLQAGGRALCILDHVQAWQRLSGAPRLAAEDVEHGVELERLIRPPKPVTQILVPRHRRAA